MTSRKQTWFGGTYVRGGLLHTKHGTTYRREESFRTPDSDGIVHSTAKDGRLLGTEKTGTHHYGTDPKQPSEKERKKFQAFVRRHSRKGARGVKAHIRRLK